MGSVAVEKEEEREIFLSLPCEDTARRWPSANQEEGPHQESHWPVH